MIIIKEDKDKGNDCYYYFLINWSNVYMNN